MARDLFSPLFALEIKTSIMDSSLNVRLTSRQEMRRRSPFKNLLPLKHLSNSSRPRPRLPTPLFLPTWASPWEPHFAFCCIRLGLALPVLLLWTVSQPNPYAVFFHRISITAKALTTTLLYSWSSNASNEATVPVTDF